MTELEALRRELVQEINAEPLEREGLENKYGEVFDTAALTRDFSVLGFSAPFVIVKRKSDGCVGSLMFQHMPRYYFAWKADETDSHDGDECGGV